MSEEVKTGGATKSASPAVHTEAGRSSINVDVDSQGSDISSKHQNWQPTDWKKYADDTFEEFVSSCPGSPTGTSVDDKSDPLTEAGSHLSNQQDFYEEEPHRSDPEPMKPPENAEQFLRFVFHVYVNEDVSSITLLAEKPLLSGNITMYLSCNSGTKRHWISSTVYIHPNEQDAFRYRYIVKYKEGMVKWLLKTVGFSRDKDEHTARETKWRGLSYGANQYDIFKHPRDYDVMKTIFIGQTFYINLLYERLTNGDDPKEVLIECEHVGFGHPSYAPENIDRFFEWVNCMCSKDLTCYQGAFISSLLGQLVWRTRNISAWYACRLLAETTAHRILTSLRSAMCDALPNSCVKFVKVVAEDIFKKGSSNGYLTFISYFCHLFDFNYVTQVADKLSKPYTEDQFDKRIPDVVESLKNLRDQDQRSKFSSYMISRSPSVQCLWNLYEVLNKQLPEVVYNLTENFAQAYCKFISKTRVRKPDFLEPPFWINVPQRLKGCLREEFCEALTNQVSSDTSWSVEKIGHLKILAFETCLQSSKRFFSFFSGLATHKSKDVMGIVPELLHSPAFEAYWMNVAEDDKRNVCCSWLKKAFSFCGTGNKPKDKVLQLVRACEVLSSSCSLKNDKTLRTALETEVDNLLQKTSVNSIMDAYGDTQGLDEPAIQQRLILLLRTAIRRETASGDTRSRMKQMIRLLYFGGGKGGNTDLRRVKLDGASEEVLLSALELAEMPAQGEQKDCKVEPTLKAMISASELWLRVLSAIHPQSKLSTDPKVWSTVCTLNRFMGDLQSRSVRVCFLLDLNKEEVRLLSKFCALACAALQPLPDHEQPNVDKWMEQVSLRCKEAQAFHFKFSQLQQAIAFLVKVSEGIVEIFDVTLLFSEINTRKEHMTDTTLKDVQDESWGALQGLMDSGEAIHKLQSSAIFFNVCRRCLTETFVTSNLTLKEASVVCEFTTDNIAVSTAVEIMAIVTSKGWQHFQEACSSLFDCGSDPTIEILDMLLEGLEDQNALQEVKMIGNVPKEKERMLLNYLRFPIIHHKVEQLMSFFTVLGFAHWENLVATKDLQSFVSYSKTNSSTLSSLSEVVTDFLWFDTILDESLTDIIQVLTDSSELISFLQETAKEDIRILIDAVEEHSDQFVSEATVSDLIDIHGFLCSILKETPSDPIMFLCTLEKCYKNLEKKAEMAAKIKECSCSVHSLRGLYMNVANRGEVTKEIISRALERGCYLVRSNADGSYDVQLSYQRQEGVDKDSTYTMADLNDLRSRALLIVNTDKKQEKVKGQQVGEAASTAANLGLPEFIKQVELITDILNKATILRDSGNPEFKTFWSKLRSTKEIQALANRLIATLAHWESVLRTLRKDYFFLNFFHPDQLWTLKKFFDSGKEDFPLKKQILSLLRFVDPGIQLHEIEGFCSFYMKPEANKGHERDLRAIGQLLDAIFSPCQTAKKPMIPQQDLQRAAKPGELFVAVLEPGSTQTAHIIMALFENTAGCYPQPSQVLFCHSETSWDEIERLLERSFQAPAHSTTANLHCLANVENLSNDLQFELVAAIRKYHGTAKYPYLLSIVCCGGSHHHIADQFSYCSHNVMGMTDVQLRATLKKNFPDVYMVTSDLPGVGKTETIHEHAAFRKKRVVTVPISGPFSRRNLVKHLSSLHVRPHECLHFDVGGVDDPLVLDTFMFELIVVGMVSSGTELCHLPTKHIYIEIANTLRNSLQDSLPVTKCFSPLHVKLDGYQDFIVSQESSSSVQVICQHLHALEAGFLESKDVVLTKLKPLPPERCKALLSKHFSPSSDLSYNVVETFINVFANQLLKFSASPFFKPDNLKVVLGPFHDVRVRLFKALLEVAREFASRSVVTCKSVQSEAITKEQAADVLKQMQLAVEITADKMVERVEGMIHWADNNHLVIVFHSLQALTVSALYRELSLVPASIQKLFQTQAVKGKGMEDFNAMSQQQLQQRLDQTVRTTPRGSSEGLLSMSYALTADNMLKMVLIIQRIKARVQVIVMGETGCGKTSLVRYLAKTCDVPFHVFNFHAGVTEEELAHFVSNVEKEANLLLNKGEEIWVFLDEINTCDYIGTINEMICYHSIKGVPLSSNLVFIAACNPYRLRPPGKITTAGLSGKTITDEYSRLVYRVHPLPETMIDYVWDYGSLSVEDERAYICRMLEGVNGILDQDKHLFVDLLCQSQEYIRDVDKSQYCVSLRDAHRCIVLASWFKEMLQNRKDLSSYKGHMERFHKTSRNFPLQHRSFVLGLAHCYQSRLPTLEARQGYSDCIVRCFAKHGKPLFQKESFEAIVRAEQEEYLERMELPDGTARNAALRENVFVMLVCILNRIPVFVVGKPGCSKSLSMQIIRSNLRGKDSKDSFLKTLPQLYVVSHQGSESSTSDGIVKVFQKARKYKEHNNYGDVLPVVLLDEIGLAEVSKYNPLKVLHSLLEPGDGGFPDVAVVGISNWALDAAKMNRAIHLSRPEPDVNDLFETGKSLREAQHEGFEPSCTRSGRRFLKRHHLDDKQLLCLAEAYHEYQGRQTYANFHGLRDYYSLIKCLSTEESQMFGTEGRTAGIQHSLQRNFGGLPRDVNNFQSLFREKLQTHEVVEESSTFPVTSLICDNLRDRLARHLMIITNGDSAIGILEQTLRNLDKETITIFGSQFEEDISEDYNYRILSRIILCMERDCVLILRDLENIYGSLYDMLNQNYTVVGGKRNCRVALGAFSNPMCQVHDGFRCIVLIDQGRVDYTDPPFLNRFEKQLLRFADVLTHEQREVINSLKDWVRDISSIPGFESHFHEEDMFIGFNEDTMPSLVLHNSQDPKLGKYDILEQCKRDLMLVASPDGVVRSLESVLSRSRIDEVQSLYNSYFRKPLHNGLGEFLRHTLSELPSNQERNGVALLVMTHDNINVNVSQCLDGFVQCQTEKLSAFKSEKQLTKQLQRFWTSDDTLLVLQCKPELDAPHMLLAKSVIEQQRREYIQESSRKQVKHVCIVIHVQRERRDDEDRRWQFSFQSGWKQVTLDVLEKPHLSLTECLDVSVMDLLGTQSLSFVDVASDQLLWCFTRIKYPVIHQPTLDTILQLEQLLRSCSKVLECFREIVYRWIEKRATERSHESTQSHWQVCVACDRQALIRSSHLVGAIQHHIMHLIRQPLAKIIYFLEKESAWPGFVFTGDLADGEDMQIWIDLIRDEEMFNIDEVPDHHGAESYLVSENRSQLEFPCASIFYKKVEQVRQLFVEDWRRLILDETNLNETGELHDVAAESQLHRFAQIIREKIPQIFEFECLQTNIASYAKDLLDIKTSSLSNAFSREDRIEFIKATVGQDVKFPTGGDPALVIIRLHSLFWLNESSYMDTLQVFEACHKLELVDLCDMTSNYSSLFDHMLLNHKSSESNDGVLGLQENQCVHSSDTIDEGREEAVTTAEGHADDQVINVKEGNGCALAEVNPREDELLQSEIQRSNVEVAMNTNSAEKQEVVEGKLTDGRIEGKGNQVLTGLHTDMQEEDETQIGEIPEDSVSDLRNELAIEMTNGERCGMTDKTDDGGGQEGDKSLGGGIQEKVLDERVLAEESAVEHESDQQHPSQHQQLDELGQSGAFVHENVEDSVSELRDKLAIEMTNSERCGMTGNIDDGGGQEGDKSMGGGVQERVLDERDLAEESAVKDESDEQNPSRHQQLDEQGQSNAFYHENVEDVNKEVTELEEEAEGCQADEEEKGEDGDGDGDFDEEEDKGEEEKETNEVDSKRFEEIFVENFCDAFFPTENVVKRFKGPIGWQQAACLFLSVVSKMGVPVPAFHFLRVCHDFATLVVLPEALQPSSLYMLGDLGKAGASEGYLDSQDLFDQISDLLDELQKGAIPVGRLEEFLALFYARCIDSNPDTPVLGSILKRICSSGSKSLISLAGPIIHRIFLIEEDLSPGVFEALLHSVDSIEEHPGLLETSLALSALAEDVELEMDSPFAVMCCDLINEVAFKNIDLDSISSSEDRILLNFRKAFQSLNQPFKNEENYFFGLLCSTAYLRAFLASFAKLILRNRSCLTDEGQFSMLVGEVNAALSWREADPFSSRVSELRIYLLKELRKELSMHEIGKVCRGSPNLSALKVIEWQDEGLIGKLSFDPFKKLTYDSTAQAALANLLEKNDDKPLTEAIVSMVKSATERVEMAAVMTKSFYLIRSKRDLRDTEEKAIAFFTEKIDKLQLPYSQLLLRVIGKKDFNGFGLRVSPESTPVDVHRATLILHLCILLVSNWSASKSATCFFMSLLTDPLKSKDSFVLASGGSSQLVLGEHCDLSDQRYAQTISCFCSCGTFFAVKSDKAATTCPHCTAICKGEANQEKEKSLKKPTLSPKGYAFLPPTDSISFCVRRLKPVEFRVLRLFVHAALYSGYSLELADEKCLSQFMCFESANTNPAVECLDQIVNDLQSLCRLLDTKEEDVVLFLHYALEKVSPLLLEAEICGTETARMAWENKFSEVIGPLINGLNQGKPSYLPQSFDDELSPSGKLKVEEKDNPTFSNTEERNMHIPRLLRVTRPRSLDNLRTYYMTSEEDVKEKHPLLGLFLDYHSRLPLVSHLTGLLTWSRVVDSQLSRRLSRRDAKTTIGDVIRGEHRSAEDKKHLKEVFESFNQAWEKTRMVVMEKVKEEVPYLSETSPISLCLVEKRDQGRFLCTALEILQNIQNEFLRKVLTIAVTGKCSALSFLEKGEGKSAIRMVHLQDAREKEIIGYQWSDDILRHSHRNTEYGHGKEIFYDLEKIEKEMAIRFLLGRSFLSTVDGLHEFIFSGELFHSCRSILDDLQRVVPQQPLTEDLRRGIVRLSESSLQSVQNLLEHMEIVLCLLKRHQVGEPDEPLTEFTDKWLTGSRSFPKASLPQPHSALQLMHAVALYEFLEDILADSAAKRVHDRYRATVPQEIADKMTKANLIPENTESEVSSFKAITTALRRFIFRYLSSEDRRPDPGECLVECMKEESLWPMDVLKSWKAAHDENAFRDFVSLMFPEELNLGQTYEVLCLYQERLKNLEQRKHLSRSHVSKGNKSAPSRSRQLKSRARFSLA